MNQPMLDSFVSIILVVENHFPQLKKLLPSLLQNAGGIRHEIIVVDNASKDQSASYLTSYPTPLKTILNKEKVTFSVAANQAIEKARGNYILLLKPQFILLPDCLPSLLACASNQNTGLVLGGIAPTKIGFTQLSANNKHKQPRSYNKFRIAFSDHTDSFYPHTDTRQPSPCILLLKSVYLTTAGLDSNLFESGLSFELGLKLQALGYENYFSPGITVRQKPNFFKHIDLLKQYLSRTKHNAQLQNKWYRTIKQSYWREKIFNKSPAFSQTPLTIAIAVTDHGQNVTAGDYYTAQELAQEFESFGWKVIYLSRKKQEWYKISNHVDVLLSLLDAYDLNKLPPRKKRLLSIAWPRNWFDLWCKMPSFDSYDMVFSSSQQSCDYIKEHSHQTPILMPIASNPSRFTQITDCPNPEFYQSDICFTGSYWGHPRDLIWGISQDVLDKYNFVIYGANWDKVDKLNPYSKGFISYEEMPYVYHHTKIVLDDANHVTKPYGSVNSRVFDALMSGALVITNGAKGSNELFHGELPYYETKDELTKLIDFYLTNDNERLSKVTLLKKIILENHTYSHRAETFRAALIHRMLLPSIAIKVPAPTWEDAHNWGDYHMAVSLKTELEKEGYRVILQVLPEWDNKDGAECDSVIVFRGLSQYTVKPHQINIMWNISHPDKVSLEEYEEYDKVYIASELWSEKIASSISTPVETMLQCTNLEIFHEPSADEKAKHQQELLFVGNSRKVFRKILRDLLPTPYGLSVYGKDWGDFIPAQYIKGEHIPNDELYKYYGSAGTVLNDHWDDMRDKGFISNRIFDALASGALVLSDRVEGMGDLEPFVNMYDTKAELNELIEYYLTNIGGRHQQAQQGIKLIANKHTFQHRAKQFSTYIKTVRATLTV